eukprot:gene3437-biopygen3030
MAVAVFSNVVLRYGFGSGVPASEELSRLLFVWMVFIGAAAAYPAGEHMAFTSLAGLLARKPLAFGLLTAVIRLLVIAACVMLGWGAWQQVVVGLGRLPLAARHRFDATAPDLGQERRTVEHQRHARRHPGVDVKPQHRHAKEDEKQLQQQWRALEHLDERPRRIAGHGVFRPPVSTARPAR